MNEPIYLDYNATTPIDPEAAEAMLPFLYGHFGNPSSSHPYGLDARMSVEKARAQVASLLNCRPGELIFTSGGTESNNYAIKGAALAHKDRGDHIITSAIEHPAVLEVCSWLSERGFRITVLPVDSSGMVNPADLAHAIDDRTILVSIMHANNEVGTIQPIQELAEIVHQHGAIMHTDAAQSVGKIPVEPSRLGVDLLSVAGHKVYAPKGIGVLYIRAGVSLEKFMHGAGHEGGHRAGTENVLEMVGLGKACQVAERDLEKNQVTYQDRRDQLHSLLESNLGGQILRLNGHPHIRLPNTLNLSFYRIRANALLDRIAHQVAASAGAACHADSVTISSVLQAMQVPVDWAMGAVRFSIGRGTTPEMIEQAASVVGQAVQELKNS